MISIVRHHRVGLKRTLNSNKSKLGWLSGLECCLIVTDRLWVRLKVGVIAKHGFRWCVLSLMIQKW